MHASYLSKPPLSDFQIVIRWLESRRDLVPCERNAPVHQDFHPDNILEDQDGKLYVIDWTNFEISDYRFDLAWTLTLAYAHGGAWRRKIILDEYENQMGQSVPHIEVFEVDAILRRIGSIMLSLTNGADSMGMRPETASLMRQQREPVHRLYERLQQLTSLRVQAVEDLLEGWA
jgi:Ser/Thr protein kinase RdoA (MazF antagonist)